MSAAANASIVSRSARSQSAGSPIALSGFVANAEARREAEPAVRLADLAEEGLDLVRQLVRPDVDVGVVLDELADARESRQRAGALVPVQAPELAVAERQVAIRPQLGAVDERRLGAVHRLQAERLVLGLDQEHVVPVQVPVAGLPPQPLADHDRRRHLEVAPPSLELAHRVLEQAPQLLALRVPERGARADVVEAEQVELDAELAMVALLRLVAPPQEGIERRLVLPDRAVDPLEHRPLLVAAPVRAGDGQELERPDLARRGDVRPAAQVAERPVLVEADRRAPLPRRRRLRGEVVEDLHLVALALALHDRAAIVERDLLAHERVVRRDALAHPRFDRGEVVRRQVLRQLEVVVEAVRDGRPDAELRAREQVEDRLGHDVGGRVAHRVELVVGARVQQLVDRAALRRLEDLLVGGRGRAVARRCVAARRRLDRLVRLVRHAGNLQRIETTPRPPTGREVDHSTPRGSTRLHDTRLRGGTASCARAALTGGSRAGSPAAHGWCDVEGRSAGLPAVARLSG